jgi:tripartite-type tricarboxylate transporter receptor subunit TctC
MGIKCIRDKARTLTNIRAFPLLPQAGACLASPTKRYFARMQHRRPDRFLEAFLAAIVGATLLFGSNIAPHAAEPEAIYKGKTVIIYIGFAPGGSYDYFGRLVARHIGKHLPGNPTVVAQSMPGAGSFTAANYLYARAPRDGTALGIVSQTVAIEEALGTSGVQYKVSQFNWIGRATSVNEVSLTFHSSGTKTIRDAIAHETTMASTGAGSPSETYLKLLNAVAATKFKLVGPYSASNDAMLAMERGEVDGAFTSYNTLKVSRQDWLRDKKINILVQYGERSADLPDVPYAVDLAKTEADRQLMAFYVSSEQIGRAFLAPPEMPAESIAVLRKAYDETMRDPQLLAEIDQSHSEFSPLSGDKLQRLVAATADVPPAIVARIRGIIGIGR